MADDKVSALRAEIDELKLLQPDWDSYGAPPIDLGAIERGKQLIATLPDWGWQIVPVCDGGIQIESHRSGYDVEIYIKGPEAAK